MAVSIGKRKRQDDSDGTENGSEDEGAFRVLFQRAFEAKFKPLERSTSLPGDENSEMEEASNDASEDSDWSGLSEDEELVEVVRHGANQNGDQSPQKNERKAFMVGTLEGIGMDCRHR